jgi:hypothetical protein
VNRAPDGIRTILGGWFPPGSVVVDLATCTTWRVLEDRVEEVLPPGHPRPGCAHATATRRPA